MFFFYRASLLSILSPARAPTRDQHHRWIISAFLGLYAWKVSGSFASGWDFAEALKTMLLGWTLRRVLVCRSLKDVLCIRKIVS